MSSLPYGGKEEKPPLMFGGGLFASFANRSIRHDDEIAFAEMLP
jgi:hypothetical protein